jgi:hypothetical protein
MKFKIEGVPYEVPNTITIEQYSKIYKIKDLFTDEYFAAKLIATTTGAPLQDLLEGGYEEISYIANSIMNRLPTQDDIIFKDRFELDGVHYGFFPNWRELTFAEFIDMDTISTKGPEEILDLLHILAAIMYRPITTERSQHDFDIEKYDLSTLNPRAELFKKKLDVGVILGAQFFFIKFAEKCLSFTPLFLTQKVSVWTQIRMIWMFWRMIYKTPLKSRSGGFWSSTKLLTTILQNTNTSTTKK